ncbi:bifunctional 3'-5' exonuclease/DNA polymerase [Planococcus sp. APC 4015]|nr:bifunctional 3'-5' exonuclease/DNA polymerase [Planococcus sp. APC 4015]
MGAADAPTWIVLGRAAEAIVAVELAADGSESGRTPLSADELVAWIAAREASAPPRWVWNDTPGWYDPVLARGHRLARCHDLRLSHAILRDSAFVADDAAVRTAREWDAAPAAPDLRPALFDLDRDAESSRLPDGIDAVLAEFARQRDAVATATEPARLRLLIAAESAGALIAAELRSAGLPWDAAEHDRILTEMLGPRPVGGGMPEKMDAAARLVRIALDDPTARLDSQPKLLRALHRVGVLVESTSRWELAEHRHPVIEPLLEYKKLSRLLSANGWAWLGEWVHDGRFRPVYVPGGVVTGRWASSGGGALQLPRQLRAAVRPDPGWRLVVADVAQLEPRVLAAISRDTALARAAYGTDLYAGIVDLGAVTSRAEAKMAILGAMYGATTGDSGRLVPRLRRTFPRAMALVDEAAATGERGGTVSTWLGRSSPAPSAEWLERQSRANQVDATSDAETRARRDARDRGRFTRNFIVQGSAAEWALSWLADLRQRLATMPAVPEGRAAPRSGIAFERRPHLAFFLHDEVIIHTPAELADEVAVATRDAATAAGRLLFGDFPVDFPLDLRVADSAGKA